MEATVISVQPNVTKSSASGPYVVHIFTYQPDHDPNSQYAPKHPTTRNVFAEDRAHPQVAGQVLAVQPGQRVQLTFEPQLKNPRFKDLVNVIVLDGGQPPQQRQQPPLPQQQGNYDSGQGVPPTFNQQPASSATPPAPQQPAKPAYKARDYAAETTHRDERDDIRQASIQRQCCLKAAVTVVNTLLEREGYYAKKFEEQLIVDKVVEISSAFEAYLLGLNDKFDQEQGVDESQQFPEPQFNADDDIPF